MRALMTSIKMTIALTVVTGLAYPLAMTGLAHLLFPYQADGSLVIRDGKPVGSALIGQNFNSAKYFHSRPSAAGDKGYDSLSSGGSNLGPTNKALIDTVRTRLKAELETDPGNSPQQIPIDLVTASGSGLDPEISPAAAQIQVARVAKARGMTEASVRSMIDKNTRPRLAGVIGEPGVNVLMLNLDLDDSGGNGRVVTGSTSGTRNAER